MEIIYKLTFLKDRFHLQRNQFPIHLKQMLLLVE